MKRDLLNWIILALVLAVAGWQVYTKYEITRPCAEPIHYAIGAVDTRFKISKTTLTTNAKAAATIWNKAAGKTVLVYDPESKLRINLIYDEREQNAQLGLQILQAQDQQDAARATLDSLQATFTAKQNAYNETVRAINARGGTTRVEAAELRAQRDALNALANSINNQVKTFNASVAALNAVVAQFNQTAGHTFEEGQYVRDASGERINIFEFVGTTQLERVLAHEFGHAIGLDHNDNPKSIMYAQNESGNLAPTKTDLAALHTLCGT